ncbi:MAG: hypothetical protein HWD61_01115 [Parachlamydiaceae bacterium]|nr:MAG: hypothetical protein HWD61_01115 [Parachlamydiaceae bacterium]
MVQNLPPPQVDLQSEKTADHEDKNKESVENEGEESVKSEVIDDPLEDLFPDSTQLSPKAKKYITLFKKEILMKL